MTRTFTAAALLAFLPLAACQQPASPPSTVESGTAAPEPLPSATPTATPTPAPSSDAPAMVPPVASESGVNDGKPDLTPVPTVPEQEKGVKGARNVLLSFVRAIELKEFDQAWGMMDDHGHQQWSKRDFAKLFANLGKITVAVPGGDMEGAAGSSYYSSQATITAKDKDGRPVRIEGPIVLRRVNDVPGASAYDLHWHVWSADLKWTH